MASESPRAPLDPKLANVLSQYFDTTEKTLEQLMADSDRRIKEFSTRIESDTDTASDPTTNGRVWKRDLKIWRPTIASRSKFMKEGQEESDASESSSSFLVSPISRGRPPATKRGLPLSQVAEHGRSRRGVNLCPRGKKKKEEAKEEQQAGEETANDGDDDEEEGNHGLSSGVMAMKFIRRQQALMDRRRQWLLQERERRDDNIRIDSQAWRWARGKKRKKKCRVKNEFAFVERVQRFEARRQATLEARKKENETLWTNIRENFRVVNKR